MRHQPPGSIAQNIKKYRLLNHMTQEELSALLELDTQYYSQLERGERNFTLEKIIRLCHILHVGIEDIVPISPDPAPDTRETVGRIVRQLEQLTPAQLSLLEKFIAEVLVYAK